MPTQFKAKSEYLGRATDRKGATKFWLVGRCQQIPSPLRDAKRLESWVWVEYGRAKSSSLNWLSLLLRGILKGGHTSHPTQTVQNGKSADNMGQQRFRGFLRPPEVSRLPRERGDGETKYFSFPSKWVYKVGHWWPTPVIPTLAGDGDGRAAMRSRPAWSTYRVPG